MNRRAPMLCTHVSEFPDADTGRQDDGRRLSAVAGPSQVRAPRPASACPPALPEKRLSGASPSGTIIRPTLHHFGLTTANLEAMVDWYANVLGMEANKRSSTPVGAQSVSRWRIAWVSNDQASHRIAIMALPGLTDDAQRSRHKGFHHVAFEYASLDDLLVTHARLKGLGIEPVRAADHGAITSFYYEDPDRNSIELMVENVGAGEQSGALMQTSPAFATNAMGTDVDPEQMIAARAAGMSVAEIHERAYAGEFCSANGFYRHCLITAANRSTAG
jgi:catechol 2,3-dioxygenase-like lactoylglutathione lyase family enzyme